MVSARYSASPLFRRSAIPRVRCSAGPLFRESAVPQVRYSAILERGEGLQSQVEMEGTGTAGLRLSGNAWERRSLSFFERGNAVSGYQEVV